MSHLSIIFDLDGTLLDTLDDIAETANQVLGRLRMAQHPTDTYRHYVGDGLLALMQRSCPSGTDDATIDHCCALFSEIYAKNWKKGCRPFDGINQLLLALKNLTIPLAILSNKPHRFTQLFVEELLPQNMFSAVYGQREGFARKPDPAAAYEIARQFLFFILSEFVGDSGVDIATGRNAGMITVGVLWGFRDAGELTAAHADFIISQPMELVDHVVAIA